MQPVLAGAVLPDPHAAPLAPGDAPAFAPSTAAPQHAGPAATEHSLPPEPARAACPLGAAGAQQGVPAVDLLQAASVAGPLEAFLYAPPASKLALGNPDRAVHVR